MMTRRNLRRKTALLVAAVMIVSQLVFIVAATDQDIIPDTSDPAVEDQHPEQTTPDDLEADSATPGTTTPGVIDETPAAEEDPPEAATPRAAIAAPFAALATFAADGTAVAKFVADNHVLMLRADGRLLVWGSNTFGQLGLGQGAADTIYTPVENTFFAGKKIRDIAVCEDASFVLLNNGELYAFGKGLNGRLGNGSTSNVYTPTLITGSASWRINKLYPGKEFVIAATDDNKLYGWGRNNYGQIGNGTKSDVMSPVKIMDNADIKHFGVGDDYALLIKQDDTLWGWGNNDKGQFPFDGEYKVGIVTNTYAVVYQNEIIAEYVGSYNYRFSENNVTALEDEPKSGDIVRVSCDITESLIPVQISKDEYRVNNTYTPSKVRMATEANNYYYTPSSYYGSLSGTKSGKFNNYDITSIWTHTTSTIYTARANVKWTEATFNIDFDNTTEVSKITEFKVGSKHGYFKYDGKFYSFGDSSIRQQSLDGVTGGVLSRATTINNFISSINNDEGFSELTVAKDTNYIISGTGNVYVWGSNLSGKAGTGSGASYIQTPTSIDGLNGKTIAKIVPGRNTTYYISHTGDVYVTGDNYYGQTGMGDAYADEIKITTPMKIETYKFSDTAIPPDAPDTINTPDEVEAGTHIEIEWPEVASATEYELVRYVVPKNSGAMTFAATTSELVYSGDQSRCTDIALDTWDSVAYGLRAVNFIGDKSSEVTSSNIAVLDASGGGGNNGNNNNNNNGNNGSISQDYLDSLTDLINSLTKSQQDILKDVLKLTGNSDSTINVNSPDTSQDLITALLALTARDSGGDANNSGTNQDMLTALLGLAARDSGGASGSNTTTQEIMDLIEKISAWQPPPAESENDALFKTVLLKLLTDNSGASGNMMPVFLQMPGRTTPRTANVIISIIIILVVVGLCVVNLLPEAEEQS